jgi:aryl-alcohol dehydrogenase-like predicted oxidoreductase
VEQIRLGSSGLVVSRLCLGTMTFGLQADEPTSFAILNKADEAGVTFLDTADVYPARGPVGRTEEILGRWLKNKRDRFVLASKCGARIGSQPFDEGCSRSHIHRAVEASLRRLSTDYLDLYQLHRFDPATPLDETLGALDDLVRAGKVRYIGCSNWLAYQVALALGRSDLDDTARFTTVQPRYNLLHRPAERELLPLCRDQGIGVIPYNPLAGGLLTAKYARASDPPPTTRFGLSPVYKDLYWHEGEFETVASLARLAGEAGLSLTALSVARVLAHPAVSAAIIGASRPDQLAETLAGVHTVLSPDLKAELDRITMAHRGGPAI